MNKSAEQNAEKLEKTVKEEEQLKHSRRSELEREREVLLLKAHHAKLDAIKAANAKADKKIEENLLNKAKADTNIDENLINKAKANLTGPG